MFVHFLILHLCSMFVYFLYFSHSNNSSVGTSLQTDAGYVLDKCN